AGADVVLDIVGGPYLARNVEVLATGGRLVVIGLQDGSRGELNLNVLMRKRASVSAASLRARPLAEKAAIVSAGVAGVGPGGRAGGGVGRGPAGHRPGAAAGPGGRGAPGARGRRARRQDRPDHLTLLAAGQRRRPGTGRRSLSAGRPGRPAAGPPRGRCCSAP